MGCCSLLFLLIILMSSSGSHSDGTTVSLLLKVISLLEEKMERIESDLEDTKKNIPLLQEKVDTLENVHEEDTETISALKDQVESMETAFEDFKKNSRTPAVAFHAVLTRELGSISRTRLLFDRVLLDLGNGYDASTGKFTAKHHGLYTFAVKLQTPGKNSDMYLMKNGDQVEFIVGGHSGRWDMASLSAFVELRAGDAVWVEGVYFIHGHSGQHRTTFSGALFNLLE